MYQDTRKQLKTVDISCYSKELATFQEKLKFRELAASTISNYLSNLKIILAWVVMFLSSKPADRISYDDFRMFLEFLTSGDLKPRSVNVYIATMKQFRYLIQCEDWNRYEIQFKKYDQTLPNVPSVEQARAITRGTETLLEKLLIAILLSTGVRISEACALTFGDILRDRKLIYIRPGKGRSDRYVPLTDEVLIILEAYCREVMQSARCSNPPVRITKESVIFRFNDNEKPANPNFLRRVFSKVVNRAFSGKEKFTPHCCRHYFALQVYLQKKDLILVKELLGHHSLNATEVYLRLAAAMGLAQEGYTNPLVLCLNQGDCHV